MKKIKMIFICLWIFVVCGCNYKLAKTADSNSGNNSLSANQIITFQLIQSYSLTSCQNCHAGKQAPQLTSLSDLKTHSDLVWSEVSTNAMPPTASGYEPLSSCKKALLKKWIDLGMPSESTATVGEITECKNENQQPAPPVIPISLMPLNYETLKTRILQPKCLLCHSAGGEQSDMSFFPYSELMVMARFWKSPAVKSKVFDEITKVDGMPPLDSNIPVLTSDEIDFVKRWIDAGNPEK